MSEWAEYNLGAICEIFDGPHATPPKTKTGNVFLGISSLDFTGRIDPAHFEFVSDEFFKKWTRRVEPKQGDIVFSYETKLGTAAYVPKNFKFCLGRRMGLLRPNSNVDPKFLLYSYLGPQFQKIIHERTYNGSTVDRIPLKEMSEFPIFLPPLPEQKAIASVLSSLDDKIDLLHRQNKTLEAMAETLFRQWFVEEADEGWEQCKVSDISDHIKINVKPSSDPNSEYYHYSLPAFDENQMPKIEIGSSILSNKYKVVPNSILISKLNPRFPRIWSIGPLEPENSICSTEFQVFKPRNQNYYGFFYFFLKSDDSVSELEMAASGTSGSHQRVKPTDISNLTVKYKTEMQIKKFSEMVQPFIIKMNSNKNNILSIQKIRNALLPKLMSGEVQV